MGALRQHIFIYFVAIICFVGCKPDNEEGRMEQEKKRLIEMCLEFAERVDALEKKAFDNGEYQLKQFVPDFNRLFDKYAHGTKNRTISGLNFRNPPRYANIKTSKKTVVEVISETRYSVTFEGAQKWKSIRFILDKKQSKWKLIHFETYVGIANHGENKGEEIWTEQKL